MAFGKRRTNDTDDTEASDERESNPESTSEATEADPGDADASGDTPGPDRPAMVEERRTEERGSDPPGPPPSLSEQLQAARAASAENYDRFVRTRAELENVLKRHERADRIRYGAEGLARDLLSVVDDLERALAHAGEQDSAIVEGVRLVHASLLETLARHGIERVPSQGQPFDPNVHEAVAMVENSEVPPNTVVQEHRAGYKLHDRLLRAAMVVVSRAG
jgi:molecular chaperone GrpE